MSFEEIKHSLSTEQFHFVPCFLRKFIYCFLFRFSTAPESARRGSIPLGWCSQGEAAVRQGRALVKLRLPVSSVCPCHSLSFMRKRTTLRVILRKLDREEGYSMFLCRVEGNWTLLSPPCAGLLSLLFHYLSQTEKSFLEELSIIDSQPATSQPLLLHQPNVSGKT